MCTRETYNLAKTQRVMILEEETKEVGENPEHRQTGFLWSRTMLTPNKFALPLFNPHQKKD